MSKLNVGIIFGGKSAEHEVSIQSALSVYDAIDRSKYEPYLIGIDKTGKWYFDGGAVQQFILNRGDPAHIKLNYKSGLAALVPEGAGTLYSLDAHDVQGASGAAETSVSKLKLHLDVIFPVLHGPNGEDGTVQGLLKLAGIPFVGPGVLASAVGMDKDVTKRLLRDAGIPVARWVTLKRNEKRISFNEAKAALGSPLFIKPANMGSSVGVNKAHNEKEYDTFLTEAFLFDTKVLIEEAVTAREIECAVLGNGNCGEPMASIPGEIVPTHEFYSYDAKYLDENGAVLKIPAELTDAKCKEAQALAVQTFNTLCCEGLSRVDMFLCPDGKLLVNEINTMPGFTKISMYPKLWEASGIPYPALIDKLICLAIERHNAEKSLRINYLD
ncbi:MAG: D-alanine--D-alanine ligase [Spirochaetaceae bacterium]|jgi:D-alanine-D-alanine ligase|nr:D-alanine--D-alanine ligase [Spirochaetaceae bacterium]